MRSIDSAHHSLIRRTIERQLGNEPEIQTRNRKPLEAPAPFAATWELSFGPDNRFRVLYQVDEERKVVGILAIGTKDRDRLRIGTKEYR